MKNNFVIFIIKCLYLEKLFENLLIYLRLKAFHLHIHIEHNPYMVAGNLFLLHYLLMSCSSKSKYNLMDLLNIFLLLSLLYILQYKIKQFPVVPMLLKPMLAYFLLFEWFLLDPDLKKKLNKFNLVSYRQTLELSYQILL